MTADALATAFMVMGLEEAEAFCKADTTIDAYFIYSGENGEFKTFYTEGNEKIHSEIRFASFLSFPLHEDKSQAINRFV